MMRALEGCLGDTELYSKKTVRVCSSIAGIPLTMRINKDIPYRVHRKCIFQKNPNNIICHNRCEIVRVYFLFFYHGKTLMIWIPLDFLGSLDTISTPHKKQKKNLNCSSLEVISPNPGRLTLAFYQLCLGSYLVGGFNPV